MAAGVALAQWLFLVPQARISNWSAAALGGLPKAVGNEAGQWTAFPPPPTVGRTQPLFRYALKKKSAKQWLDVATATLQLLLHYNPFLL